MEEQEELLHRAIEYIQKAITEQRAITRTNEKLIQKKTAVYLEMAIDNISDYISKTEIIYTPKQQGCVKSILANLQKAAKNNQNKSEPERLLVQLEVLPFLIGNEIAQFDDLKLNKNQQ